MKQEKASFLNDEVKEQEPARKYVVRSTVIDRYTIKRERVLVTPSMCTKYNCNFDAARSVAKDSIYTDRHGVVQFPKYEDLGDLQQEQATKVLAEHIRVIHGPGDDYIIEEKDLPNSWLGGKNDRFSF